MDRNLPGNHKFWLNEDASSNNDGKMHIFVKLTDSFQIQNQLLSLILMEEKYQFPQQMLIERHTFNISPEDKTPEVFQCIKQINRDQLEGCALIEQRLNIHAQEDVYSMTITNVTKKNEEQNKKQTKEIGESTQTILQNKIHKPSNKRSSTSTSTTTTTLTNSRQARPTINLEQHLSPTNNQLLSCERPLRERLVHILAAKIYRKPELLLRLKKDGGIRDDEKDQLDTLLSSISTQSKTGEFYLLTSILTSGEINYDWPFYPKAEASFVQKKIKEYQNNPARSAINKTTNDNSSSLPSSISNRPSLTNTNTNSANKISTTTSSSGTKTKLNSSTNRLTTTTINDKQSSIENEEILTTKAAADNPLCDERIQQLSDMLDKISSALSHSDKSNDQLSNAMEFSDEYNIDQAENEYNRLVPEYNSLVDYLKTVSEKFSLLEQQFNEDKTNEKASKIVEEFFKCENSDGFINKRQRLIELHIKLISLQKIFEKTSPLNNFHISDDDHHDC
ncbi:unnamed protein product [Rotaria magnacalcarata]|uniref:OCEL domain-containing protein n=1 Tax=Rotaria magnacalcarata TaxID=392030 RepID=A0A816LK07_9BILA|nr:unnamed protein product [Rotaria magnacalcarata]